MAGTIDVTKFVSFNLYGLSNGLSMLNELCNDPDVSVIAIQEHWLSEDKLYTEHCSVWFYQLIDYYGQDDARKRMTEKGFLRWPDGATAV